MICFPLAVPNIFSVSYLSFLLSLCITLSPSFPVNNLLPTPFSLIVPISYYIPSLEVLSPSPMAPSYFADYCSCFKFMLQLKMHSQGLDVREDLQCLCQSKGIDVRENLQYLFRCGLLDLIFQFYFPENFTILFFSQIELHCACASYFHHSFIT